MDASSGPTALSEGWTGPRTDLAGMARRGENRSAVRRAILSCGLGQVFEIYDFLICAFMAAPLAKAFFPSLDPVAGLLSTFATFAVGFAMRPVGAVVIGSYGDRHGRRAALVMTIGLMAVGTGAIGLLPSHATWGIAAPVLLVLCRMAQGFSTGGEWGGAAAFLVEYSSPGRRGWISSFQQAATALGLLLATLVAYGLTASLDPGAFTSWGWRLAFLLGFVLGPVGHYLRTHVHETPAFERAAEGREVVDAPLRLILRGYKKPLLLAFGISISACVVNYVLIVFFPSFAQQQLKIPASTTFLSTAISGVVYLVLAPALGALSDEVGRRAVFLAASSLSAALAYPLFLLAVAVPTAAGLILTQAMASVLLSMYCGPLCAILAEQFPTRVRYSALSIAYGFAVTIFGGGYGGPGSKTVLPCAAVAKCDIRLVEAMTPADALAKVAAHVRRHAPDVEFVPMDGILPSKTPMDLPFLGAIRGAILEARGVEPLVYPSLGGSLPDYVFTKILGIPAYVVPYANADESNHAPNENLRLDCFHDGIRTGAALLTRLGGVDR